MAIKKKMVKLDARHDRCRCGAIKLKTSPVCRTCYIKSLQKPIKKVVKKALQKVVKKKNELTEIGKQLAEKSEQRIKEKKRYNELQRELFQLEKKILPSRFSYGMFLVEGEKYLRFPSDVVYPIPMVSGIIANAKKTELKDGHEMVGMILQIPSNLGKFLKKKPTTSSKTTAVSNPAKRSNQNARTKPTTKTKTRTRRRK